MGADSDFSNKMREVAERAQKHKEKVRGNEEATKNSLILPFFVALGYDVYDPAEFWPEYTADVGSSRGIKNGEKVDYAILDGGAPKMLVECKAYGEKLDKHGDQLFRYFATTSAKIGILTDGVVYRFYTDIDEDNVMDLDPFLVIDMLDLTDSAIAELEKYRKPAFDPTHVMRRAEELKHGRLIRERILNELENPSDEFVCLIIDGFYEGVKTQHVKEKYRPLLVEQFRAIVNDKVQKKFEAAISNAENTVDGDRGALTETDSLEEDSSYAEALAATGDDEISRYYQEAYRVVCDILARAFGSSSDASCKRTTNYMSVEFCGRWICKVWGQKSRLRIDICRPGNGDDRIYIDRLDDLSSYSDELIAAARYWRERS